MSDIIVKFKPKGDKELIRAIKLLTNASDELNDELKFQQKQSRKTGNAFIVLGQKIGFLSTKSKRNVKANAMLSFSLSTMRSKLLLASFGVNLLAGAFALVTVKLLGAASETEKLKTRLTALYGSVTKGSEVFANFTRVASTTPFAIDQVVQAGASLKSFGVDAEANIKPLADLAAYMNTDIVNAASAMGRAFAGGVGAADVFREKGVLNIIKEFNGIKDLTKITLPEFRRAMIATFVDPNAGIAGATSLLANTFAGSLSNMQDAFFQFSSAVGEFFLGPTGQGLRTMTATLQKMTEHLKVAAETPMETLIRKMQILNIDASKYQIILLEIQKRELENSIVYKTTNEQMKERSSIIGQSSTKVKQQADLTLDLNKRLSLFFKTNNKDLNDLAKDWNSYNDILIKNKGSVGLFDNTVKDLFGTFKDNPFLNKDNFVNPDFFKFNTEQFEQLKEDMKEFVLTTAEMEQLNIDLGIVEGDITKLAQIKVLMKEIELLQQATATTLPTPIDMALPKDQEDILRKSVDRNKEVLLELETSFKAISASGNFGDAIIAADAYAQQLGKVISQENALLNIQEAKIKSFGRLAGALGSLVGSTGKNTKEQARLAQAAAIIDTYAGANKAFKQGGVLGFVTGAAIIAQGLANVVQINTQLSKMGGSGGGAPQFEDGGYVGGRRHSQGGTMIEAERGEFVMSRNAVESIGTETLNQMNQGGGGGTINVSVTGNVLTQDYVEGELAEAIKEAARRGSDFGLS
tara:strand:+ start:19 stop:2268 length:2250 start_codon:yes stop_codon:yes gene_type:complete